MNSDTFSRYKQAAIYCRVSTEDQSCERQERDLQAFAERAGYKIVAVHKETASGTKTNRQARQEVMKLAQARKIDAVLVTELTRWGRSTVDLLESLQTLNSFNVSVIAQSGSQFDLSTAQGKMIAGVLSVLAQFERDLISERTKSGLATAKAKGKKLGRPTGKQSASKHEAAIKELRQAGFSYRAIASKLKISLDTVGEVLRKQ